MAKRVRLRRFPVQHFVNTFFKGLEVIGSFTNERGVYYELYKLPNTKRDFGILGMDGLCQVHPASWHENRDLEDVTQTPINERIKQFEKDAKGIRRYKILPITTSRVKLNRRTKLRRRK